jgi:hypothetical protein
MTEDRRTIAWAQKYRELLRGYVDAMGGAGITAPRRALAEQISVLQTELGMLTDRFASGGRGGSTEDLAMYLKLSDSATELMRSAGLGASLEAPIVDHARGDDARDKLREAFDKIIAARDEDERHGIFHDASGAVITDPTRLALAQQIYDLQRQAEAIDSGTTIEPAPEPMVITKVPPPAVPTLTIVAGTDAIKPDRELYAYSGLEERRHQLVRKREDLARERNRLSEQVLTNPALHAQLNDTIAKQAAVDAELRDINAAIAKAAPDTSSQAYSDWMTNGGGSGLITDWSPSSSWRGF